MMYKSKLLRAAVLIVALLIAISGCAAPTPQIIEKQVVVEKPVVQTVIVEKEVPVEKKVVETVIVEKQVVVEVEAPTPEPKKAKYVFLFIGDGMAVAQRNAAELYLAATESAGARPEDTTLLINTFPAQGMNTTYDLTSVIPDSASTATAMASGFKTASGVVGMDAEGQVSYKNIAEVAKEKGWKVGIVSSVSIDHATPAAFYAHQASRSKYYEISVELANSDFDLFAGGPPLYPTGKKLDQPDVIAMAEANGFTIAVGKEAWEKLTPGVGKVWAMPDYLADSNALHYELDRTAGEVSLVGYVSKAIKLLDNPDGFFLMVEAGKVDWACHANDAGAVIHDMIAFDKAVAEAYEFYQEHPDETLIVVTGDHETGGMTIGFAGTRYSAFMDKIQYQKMSYVAFEEMLLEYKESHTPETARLDDLLPAIQDAFGLYPATEEELAAYEEGKTKYYDKEIKELPDLGMALAPKEIGVLQVAFAQSMSGEKIVPTDDYTYLLYGGYEPLIVKLTTLLNQKAGIGWTSYSHTGVPVQTSAAGVGADLFNGYYDQTDIHHKMMQITGL